MSKQANWLLAKRSLEQKIPVMLLYVLQSKGSSPGRQGFFMVVNKEGEMSGSIGGGIMEHKFVEMAKSWIDENFRPQQVFKQVHDKESRHQSGMICSGEQEIFLYCFKQADLEIVEELIHSLNENKNGCLQLTASGISFTHEIPANDYDFQQSSDSEFIYREKTGYKNSLHIVGGGHCALALSKIMRDMDFYIHVYDDRPGLHTMIHNHFAHEKHELKSFAELDIKENANSFVVIMTFGYRTDDLAMRSLLQKNFRYIGLLGSKKKIEKMFAQYKEEGVEKNWLQSVHAPIGVFIKSETPEEIAISIAAEIIREKNKAQ